MTANTGGYSLVVRQHNNSWYPLRVEVYAEDQETLLARGWVSRWHNHSPRWTYSFKSTTDQRLYVRVSAPYVSDQATEYTVEMLQDSYVGLYDYDVFEQFTNDVDGDFYYVPEIKYGDTTRFNEALTKAFEETLRPKVGDVSPSDLVIDGKEAYVNVSLLNAVWGGSESVSLVNDSGAYVSGRLVSFDEADAVIGFTLAYGNEEGCYDLNITLTSGDVMAECAVTAKPGDLSVEQLLSTLQMQVDEARIKNGIRRAIQAKIDTINNHLSRNRNALAKARLRDLADYVANLYDKHISPGATETIVTTARQLEAML